MLHKLFSIFSSVRTNKKNQHGPLISKAPTHSIEVASIPHVFTTNVSTSTSARTSTTVSPSDRRVKQHVKKTTVVPVEQLNHSSLTIKKKRNSKTIAADAIRKLAEEEHEA
ncbi:hypothetical protein HDU79_008858 [Rhizoclosmatium sp. JEL0117]|nr:hypothetical protein HDU79_008858 [Rhizoclosmatium sp. JEL0117]